MFLVTPEMVAAAEGAYRTALQTVSPHEAMSAALEVAFQHAAAAVQVRWVRGSDDDGGVSPRPAGEFPISPFESWYIMRGYEVRPTAKLPEEWWAMAYGNLEGGQNGLMLKE